MIIMGTFYDEMLFNVIKLTFTSFNFINLNYNYCNFYDRFDWYISV